MTLDWAKREGESKMRVLPTMAGYARMMTRQVASPPGLGMSVGIVGGGLLGLGIAYELAQAGVAGRALRGRQAPRRARRLHADRRRRRRPLLPLRHHERPQGRLAGRGPRAEHPLAPARRGLLPRRPPLLDVDPARGPEVPGPARWTTRPGWPRSCSPAAGSPTTRRSTSVAIEEWARKLSGNRLWERLWAPLLDSKFDGRYDDLPATYLWSRMRRTAGTRSKGGREVMGAIEGGYQALVDRLAERIREPGRPASTPPRPIRHIPASATGRALGVVTEEGLREHDTVVTTQLRPNLRGLLAPELERAARAPTRCATWASSASSRASSRASARTTRSTSPTAACRSRAWSRPPTSSIPEAVEGHLIYVPRYVQSTSADLDALERGHHRRVPRATSRRCSRTSAART